MRLKLRLFCLAALYFAGCSEPKAAIGDPCAEAAECEMAVCDRGVCVGPCDLAGACPENLACGIDPSGAPQCRPRCDGTAEVDGFGCEGGAEIACGFAQSAHCEDCGCESGDFCSSQPGSNGECLPGVAW